MLLRCRHNRRLTQVAEALCQLLHPFRFLHVYIPVLPLELAEFLEVCVRCWAEKGKGNRREMGKVERNEVGPEVQI